MPRFEVTSPDGKRFEVTAPEGATQDQVISYAQSQFEQRSRIGERIASDPISEGARNFAANMPVGEQFLAGTGKAFADIGRGAAQIFGFGAGPSAADVAESRKLDLPLMRTPGGISGNVMGNITAFAPLSVIPGANTIAGAGAIGSTIAALQPAESLSERLTKQAIGFGLGAGTQAASTVGAQKLGEMAAAREARQAARAQQGAVRNETLRRGVEAGYVVPPSAVNPSFVNKRLESVAGKAAVGQEAAIRNQAITDEIARTESGLAPNTPITLKSLAAARDEMAGPYREVADLSPIAKRALENWRESNKLAQQWYRAYEKLPLPSLQQKAERFVTNADNAHALMLQEASNAGKPELIDALKQARINIARNYTVERALNLGSGEVEAASIGRAYDKGIPMKGGLETIARMQQTFRPYMREGGLIPTPGVSKSEALSSALLGTLGASATGSPTGIIAGGLPLLSGPARSLVLSRPYQAANVLATPQGTSLTARQLMMLRDPFIQAQLGLASRSMLPGLLSMEQQ